MCSCCCVTHLRSNRSPQSSTTRTTIGRTERKHWSLDQLQMNGLRLPTVFTPLSSTRSPTITATAAAGELEHNSSNCGSDSGGDGLGSSSAAFGGGKAQFRYSESRNGSPSPSGKVLVTQCRTEPTKGTLTPPKSHTFFFCFTPSSCPFPIVPLHP